MKLMNWLERRIRRVLFSQIKLYEMHEEQSYIRKEKLYFIFNTEIVFYF